MAVDAGGRVAVRLSPAELATLEILADGRPQKHVAEQRGVSIQTIKNQLLSVYTKLGVSSLVEAFAVLGWLRPFPIDQEYELRMILRDIEALEARLQVLRERRTDTAA